jgi:hypothetical protein
VAGAPHLDLPASFAAWLDADRRNLASGSLVVYTRAAQRFLAWAEARGVQAAGTADLRALLETYRAEINAGTWPDSQSTGRAASAAVGRWARWLEAT